MKEQDHEHYNTFKSLIILEKVIRTFHFFFIIPVIYVENYFYYNGYLMIHLKIWVVIYVVNKIILVLNYGYI